MVTCQYWSLVSLFYKKKSYRQFSKRCDLISHSLVRQLLYNHLNNSIKKRNTRITNHYTKVPWMHHPDDCRVRKVEDVNFGRFSREIYTDTFFTREASPPLRLPSLCTGHAVSCVVSHAASHCVVLPVTKWSSKYLTEPCDLSELMYSSARLHLSWGAQTRALSINWQKLRKACLTALTASKVTESDRESKSTGRWCTEHGEQCLAAPGKTKQNKTVKR